MSALDVARSEGFPDELFLGLCEWLESHIVETPNPAYRYSANTRAKALEACRHLKILRPVCLWGQS